MTTQTIPEYLEEERQKAADTQLRTEEEAARIQPLQHGHHRASKRTSKRSSKGTSNSSKPETLAPAKAVTKKKQKKQKKKSAAAGNKKPRAAGKKTKKIRKR
jgi:hypothetical protein